MVKPATLREAMVERTAKDCRGYNRWHAEKWLWHERGRSHAARLATAPMVYKGIRSDDWLREKSAMPIVVLIRGTT